MCVVQINHKAFGEAGQHTPLQLSPHGPRDLPSRYPWGRFMSVQPVVQGSTRSLERGSARVSVTISRAVTWRRQPPLPSRPSLKAGIATLEGDPDRPRYSCFGSDWSRIPKVSDLALTTPDTSAIPSDLRQVDYSKDGSSLPALSRFLASRVEEVKK